ncbi:MAG: hypothetical protein HN909_00770 [Phycisphaerales bacterium]|jgi:predicted SprT family Zn-dependent metalloprotease|nr:hypothetical protein [Phycisphaerales bacterium]MBT7170282.1 hypothetical protein [Phycisphaerales bacterium]
MDVTTSSRPWEAIWQAGERTPLPTAPLLRKLVVCFGELWDCSDLFANVRAGYNQRLRTTLGRAFLRELRVELNPRLLNDHPAELIPTLAHELAHLVVHHRCNADAASHGWEFQALLRMLRLPEDRTHNLPVEHLRQRRGAAISKKKSKFLYLHRCSDCGQLFVAAKAKRNCYCRACGPTMEWEIFRLPNTASGKQLANKFLNANG